MKLRVRLSTARKETYLSTVPILSPQLGGLWMQLAPKALWAEVVGWMTSGSRSSYQKTNNSEPEGDESEVEWAEDVLACLLDADQFQYFTDGQISVIVSERLTLLERGRPLSDLERLEFIEQALLEAPWA